MSHGIGAVGGAHGTLALRALVLLPAAATVVALIVSVMRSAETSPGDATLDLQPATATKGIPQPAFGPPLTDVHSAADAVETSRGWVVLDVRDEQIVFLDADGRFMAREGGRGEGPGELTRATHVALMDSSVVVAELSGTRLDLFSGDGAFQRRLPLGSPDCRSAAVRELLGGPGHVVVLRLCTRANGRTSVLVERVGPTGERTVLEERAFSDLRSGTLDPTRVPVLVRAGGTLFLGITPDPCVREVGARPGSELVLCHPDPHPVALPDSLRERLRVLAPRVGALGASVRMPDRYPPFEDILELDGRLAFHVILEDGGRAWDVVRGDRLERILLPAGVRVFAGRRGLLLARDEPPGTAFAVRPLP